MLLTLRITLFLEILCINTFFYYINMYIIQNWSVVLILILLHSFYIFHLMYKM